jgi:hypothetical protein
MHDIASARHPIRAYVEKMHPLPSNGKVWLP